MNPFAAVAVKIAGAGAAAALLSAGIAGGLAQAASPSSSPKPAPSANQTNQTNPAEPDPRSDRRAIRRAVLEAEADVLGIKVEALRADVRKGQKISDLARDKGMTKEQFAAKVAIAVKPRLEQLVANKEITQAGADRVLDRISKGHIPFWDGRHPRKTTSTSNTH
ncbi:MAG: hypothetical protein M3082_14475 [Candidatus Dormibacteraeota bacterium]|nr:hypothetical protein [Candidatus Dormibacteraeota bacterium]